jgi:hypothetical protein
MPYFRQRSLAETPASASFKIAMICSSLYRFRTGFIVFLSVESTKYLSSTWSSFTGGRHPVVEMKNAKLLNISAFSSVLIFLLGGFTLSWLSGISFKQYNSLRLILLIGASLWCLIMTLFYIWIRINTFKSKNWKFLIVTLVVSFSLFSTPLLLFRISKPIQNLARRHIINKAEKSGLKNDCTTLVSHFNSSNVASTYSRQNIPVANCPKSIQDLNPYEVAIYQGGVLITISKGLGGQGTAFYIGNGSSQALSNAVKIKDGIYISSW